MEGPRTGPFLFCVERDTHRRMSSCWRQTSPQELAAWFAGVDVTWGIAGGWALDLWQGNVSREHSDIEIACFRADLPRLLPKLSGFEIAIAKNKRLTPWMPDSGLPEDSFSLWLRRGGEILWDFEIVAETERDGSWVYRREPSVQRPISSAFLITARGLPIIAPEIQLLYKCKEPRPKDVNDLRHFIPLLDTKARDWLRASVAVAHPASRPMLG